MLTISGKYTKNWILDSAKQTVPCPDELNDLLYCRMIYKWLLRSDKARKHCVCVQMIIS